MSVRIVLDIHDQVEFTLPKYFIQTVLAGSILAQALENEPDAEMIPIPNAAVRPKAMRVLVKLSEGFEPIQHDVSLKEAANYLNCERLLVYSYSAYSHSLESSDAVAYGWAIEEKASCVVKYLLQKGHDPDTSNLLAAVRYDCPEIVRLLFNLPQMDWTVNDNMLLTWACGKGCFDIVQTILPRGEHKSRVNPAVRMNLPIREATARGHLDIVQYLLADPRVDPSECSNAAIISAAERNYLEVVRCLVRHPKVDPSDNDNLALQLALKNGHREVAELLGTDARVIEVKSKPPNIHPL